MTDDDPIFERANALFAASRVIEDAHRPKGTVGIAEIYRGLTDPAHEFSDDLSRALFSSPTLRAAFKSVQRRITSASVPVLAAASDKKLTERQFTGGTLRLTPARRGDQVYLTIQRNDGQAQKALILIMTNNDQGIIVKRALPATDDRGELLIVLDTENATDAATIVALEDPRSEGAFIDPSLRGT